MERDNKYLVSMTDTPEERKKKWEDKVMEDWKLQADVDKAITEICKKQAED